MNSRVRVEESQSALLAGRRVFCVLITLAKDARKPLKSFDILPVLRRHDTPHGPTL